MQTQVVVLLGHLWMDLDEVIFLVSVSYLKNAYFKGVPNCPFLTSGIIHQVVQIRTMTFMVDESG